MLQTFRTTVYENCENSLIKEKPQQRDFTLCYASSLFGRKNFILLKVKLIPCQLREIDNFTYNFSSIFGRISF